MKDLKLKHFYIPEEQSVYLLSHKDAQKLKDWLQLCKEQLELLGYRNIDMIGSGAYGFAFAGNTSEQEQLVFKFSRITLPQHIQDRLEEEAYINEIVTASLTLCRIVIQHGSECSCKLNG